MAKILVAVVFWATLYSFWQPAFLPPAGRISQRKSSSVPGVTRACSAAIFGGGLAAHADSIDDAAKKLSMAAYPFLKEIPWDSSVYAKLPRTNARAVTKAINKALIQSADMDPVALKKGVLAHSKAIGSIDAKGVCSLSDFEAINSAIGHMIASVPASKTMDVYNSFAAIVPKKDVPEYLMSTVTSSNAEAAYRAFMGFKDVVKAAQR